MEQAKAGQVLAYKFKGRRIDCGSVGVLLRRRITALNGQEWVFSHV